MKSSSYHFCPRCGHRLSFKKPAPHEPRRLFCQHCGLIFYLNSRPTASALILRDNKVLLVKRAVNPQKGKWDVPGGFLELGEKPETGVKREILEELCIKIKLTRLLGMYIGSYRMPWEESATLNILYLAKKISGRPKPGSDIASACWFSFTKLPRPAFSWMKQAFRDLQKISYQRK